MRVTENWTDYRLIDCTGGEKLELWKNVSLIRPDPQIIWKTKKKSPLWDSAHGHYHRSEKGGGQWSFKKKIPESWIIEYGDLRFNIRPTGFKHTGLFPEQAVNWDRMMTLIANEDRKINVLNLFGYTGAASVACLKAGANVCHVDSAKAMVERAGDNVRLSGLDNSGMRYIIDDCFKFCQREIRRGKKYDAIILDPPSFGRGPNGEKWKIEEGISALVELVAQLLGDNPLFVCLNSYTTGLQPTVMANILKLALPKNAVIDADEIGIATEEGLVLPQGCTAFATFEKPKRER